MGLLILYLPCITAHGRTVTYTAEIVDVYDGDTWRRKDQELGTVELRLVCADAPERKGTRWEDQPGHRQAAEFVSALLLGQKVRATHVGYSYGRELVHITLPDGEDLAEKLVMWGQAWAETKYPYCRAKAETLKGLEAEARRTKMGLWGLYGTPVRPCQWRGKECGD